MDKNRITWIDIAKGIGIFLVVLGHNSIPPSIFGYIFSFHMPLFFFLSGFLLLSDRFNNFSFFFKKKFQSLILPYFYLGLIVYLYWLVVVQKFTPFDIALLKPIADLIYGSTSLDTIFTPLWFLPSLFLTEIMFFFVYKKFPRFYLLPVIVISILAYISTLSSFKNLPWSINTSMIALVFFGIGFFIRNHFPEKYLQILKNNFTYILLFVLCSVWSLGFYWLNGTVDMLHNHYQNFLYFFLSAFGGIGLLIILANFISPNTKSINFLGRSSLTILALHSIGLAISKSLVSGAQRLMNTNISDEKSLVFGLIYSLMAILIVLPIIHLINNYFPWILGKRKP